MIYKALTVCQPYASLIMLPESDFRHKRVENRTWEMKYRGPLVIHAGKSREWLSVDLRTGFDREFGLKVDELLFGYALGLVDVVDCLHLQRPITRGQRPQWSSAEHNRYLWLADHQHVEGPWCIVLQNVRPFKTPFLYKGAQGLFGIPGSAVEEAM